MGLVKLMTVWIRITKSQNGEKKCQNVKMSKHHRKCQNGQPTNINGSMN